MKNKRFKYILIVIICYLILRELLPFDISFYKSYSELDAALNGTSNITSYEFNNELNDDTVINFDNHDDYHIYYYGLNESSNSKNGNERAVKVTVKKSTNIGFVRYLPLIKPLNYTSSCAYNWYAKVYKDGKLSDITGSGNIEFDGTKNIYGICSGKKAKILIEDTILNEIKIKVDAAIHQKMQALKPN